MTWHTVSVRVRYQETDAMGVVYHANYAAWLEIARTDWTRAQGFSYRAIEERGLLLPVVELAIQYKHPARYDDEVEVRCRVSELSPVRVTFVYEAHLAQEPSRTVVTGQSKHVWVDREWKPVRLNKAAPDIYDALQSAAREKE
ncbi:thioesterase family protein [Paenibacillus sp.]|uniref:acyl-CoA thioesterase n=1 Tax=Paenibacillus sp. TaxID=58172 RepID=UPI002D71EA4F|nr:thioesterase family protein [Paenibacillus sp.]HZG58442.1 thioesterase family protein [Paenibacillus sp.]